jgi:hypothetical protein
MADSAVEGSAGPGSEPDHTDGSPPDLGCWHICNNHYGTDLDIAQETCVFCKRLYHRACCKEMRHAILPGPDTDEDDLVGLLMADLVGLQNPDYWDTEDDLVGALMAPTERV